MIVGIAFVGAAIYVPRYLATRAASLASEIASTTFQDPKDRLALQRDLLQYETDNQIKIWTALAQVLGALVIAGGVYFTWTSLQIAHENLRATERKLDVDRQGQITNRFTQAVGQLGAELKDNRPNLEVRLGGIYALERIVKDAPGDYWMVMEILTAYVRQNARWSTGTTAASAHDTDLAAADVSRSRTSSEWQSSRRPRVDIQAILTIIGRNKPHTSPAPGRTLDLREADLRGAELWNSQLEHIDFWGAHLEGTRFWGAVLENVKLQQAHLQHASFLNASFKNVVLHAAFVQDTNFVGADLRGATGLAQEQIVAAVGDLNTKLPGHLTRPPAWAFGLPDATSRTTP